MLPATWHILNAGVARRLSRVSVLARDRGDYEVAAILYVRGRRIEGLRMLKNLSKKPAQFEYDSQEYAQALVKAPSWVTSTIFFHSHPISDIPSCVDVASARPGNQMIFGCSSRSFVLYKYPRYLRKRAKKLDRWQKPFKVMRDNELPLYVETGLKSFDSTILKGEIHRLFFSNLRRQLYEFLKETVQVMDSRGSEVIQLSMTLDRECLLDRLFGGLEHYVQFPKHKPVKKKLKEIGFYEEDFIITAYELFYDFSSYTISQEKNWITIS